MAIKGAILGDIIGSQFEFNRCKDPKESKLFTRKCSFTDDSVTSLAIKYAFDNLRCWYLFCLLEHFLKTIKINKLTCR